MTLLLESNPFQDPTTRWLLVVAVGLTIFYAVMRPMRKKKDPLDRNRLQPSLSNQRAFERDMNELLVELSDMARQMSAQLDTRTAKLEVLLKEADEKIAALQEAARATPSSNGNGSSHTAAVDPPAPAPVREVDKRHLEVYELADQKLSAQQIASKLSRPRGEIELILALRDRS